MDTNYDKPKWLKELENQSWNVELLCSGMAIFGMVQLLPFINLLADFVLINFDQKILNLYYFAVIYLYTAYGIILLGFIVHLILRLLWGGLLGLSSVFPSGINSNSDQYSRSFISELLEEYPNLTGFTMKVDRTTSLIFSTLIEPTALHYTQYPQSEQLGFDSYISIDSLDYGYHTLTIEAAYTNKEGLKMKRVIPFYKGQ